VLVWIVTLLGSLALGSGEAGPVDGTWKIREPLRFEVEGEICAIRKAVAQLSQNGSTLSGRYEAEVACWSPYAPRLEWGPRHGQIVGRIEGNEFTAQLFVGDPFPIHLRGTFEGGRLIGSFELGDFVQGEWSAAKLASGPDTDELVGGTR